MNNIDVKILLLECSIRVFMIQEQVCLTLTMHFKCILYVLLERIEPFSTVECILSAPIVLLESIDLILAHSPLCWHNMSAYYALNYAGIFDGGLYIDSYAANFI